MRVRMQPLIVIYDKEVIERTKKFFEMKNSDEFLRSAAWQKIEMLQDETSVKM